MRKVNTIGSDIAKHVFLSLGVDDAGEVVIRRISWRLNVMCPVRRVRFFGRYGPRHEAGVGPRFTKAAAGQA